MGNRIFILRIIALTFIALSVITGCSSVDEIEVNPVRPPEPTSVETPQHFDNSTAASSVETAEPPKNSPAPNSDVTPEPSAAPVSTSDEIPEYVVYISQIASPDGTHEFVETAFSEGVVISSGENFVVYDITKDNLPEYRYIIYNLDGKIVKNETVWRTAPRLTRSFDDTLLSIRRGVGPGTFLVQYYDINNDMFSDVFGSVLLEGHGKIAYVMASSGKYELEVRDIFDESVFCKRFELDFSPIANPVDGVLHIDFSGEDTITITYLSGSEYDEKTETFSIA